MDEWNRMLTENKFCKRIIYRKLLNNSQDVPWKRLFFDNAARPRAIFTLWMVCLGRIATKTRLMKFAILDNNSCVMCTGNEDLNHLFFLCDRTKSIWQEVLPWLQEDHGTGGWEHELKWMIHRCNHKGWKSNLLKTALAETVHACWLYRNSLVFKDDDKDRDRHRRIAKEIIDRIVQRIWNKPKLRGKIAPFLL
ncbi:uncharacterized protein LOC131657518 [Vicia villosa]|uniref:uncharacterized protein LOC131657518 n=1 Tax=Vicia villosa TaxID=3911 RepID=UPI00273B6F2F|nr:uncharacterized protein LOC131657518 [Vicia villosa]